MRACSSCGRQNPDDARYCAHCGAALIEAPGSAREERKVITVLFADLVGFTSRSEQLDPEDVRATLTPYFADSGRSSSAAAERSRSSSATP